MSMPFKLFRLQQIDTKLNQARLRLQQIENILKNTSELDKATELSQNAEKELSQSQKSLRKSEEEVRSQKIKIEQTEASLYGGRIQNPKELQDLVNELTALKKYFVLMEDRLLENMIDLEQKTENNINAKKYQDEIEFKASQQKQILSQEQEQILIEIDRMENDRNIASISIPQNIMAKYENLLKIRRGIAVAQVSDKTCSACGSALSASILQSANAMSQIIFCDSCGRILYGGE